LEPRSCSTAEGVAVRQVGRETFRLARRYVDDIVLVTTDELCAAIKDVFEDTRTVVEPSGALGVAGVKRWVERMGATGETYAAVVSGANVNFDRLRFVTERAELGEQREAVFAATIPERPGSFKQFCRLIGKRNLTEFNYPTPALPMRTSSSASKCAGDSRPSVSPARSNDTGSVRST
jgi:threonine dehydratase